MNTYRTVAATCGLAMLATQAFGQAVGSDKSPPGTGAPSQFDSQSRQSQRNGDNLSERLERSGGVIKPPEHADKDIHITPPATGDSMNLPPSALPPSKNPDEKEGTPK